MKSHCYPLICQLIWLLTAGLFSVIAFAPMAHGQTPATPLAKERDVTFTVSVTNDRGILIKGLKPAPFKITSDKKPLEVTSFSDEDEPISIVFLMDTSGSMQGGIKEGNLLRFLISGILNFIQTSNDANEYAILSFDKDVRLALDWTKDRRRAAEALAEIAAQPAKGYTALYDACRRGLDLTRRGSHRKRIILLLTDGQDTTSKDPRFGRLKQEIRASDVSLYAINIGFLSGNSFALLGADVTEELAKQTGGISFIPKNQFDMGAAFEMLVLLLRNQYIVGFKTSQPSNDKWHELKIEVKLPPGSPSELKYPVLKYRAGYFDRTAWN